MVRLSLIAFALTASLLVLGRVTGAQAAACGDAATQADMNKCAGDALAEADAALNHDYRRLRERLKGDPAADKKLVAAQRAWVAFRDAECAFSGSAIEGGSAYGMVVAQCKEHLTRKRVKELGYYLSCREGDLSCPAPLR